MSDDRCDKIKFPGLIEAFSSNKRYHMSQSDLSYSCYLHNVLTGWNFLISMEVIFNDLVTKLTNNGRPTTTDIGEQ